MPIVQIRALPQKNNVDVTAAMKRLCEEVASIYGCVSQQVWATWETIQPGYYLVGDVGADTQPHSSHPPLVNLVCSGKSPEMIEKLLDRGSKVLSEELQIPGNVYMTYTEAESGEIFTGGSVRHVLKLGRKIIPSQSGLFQNLLE